MIQEPATRRLRSGRLSLNVSSWGDPAAQKLLLVHGGMDHARNWDWVAAAFAQHWHVIAPDLRGHGDSDWATDGDYGMPGLVFDLAELVAGLGEPPISIIGHSYGGNVATRFAAAFPERVRRLVSIEGLGLSPKLMAEREASEPATRLRDWVEERRTNMARTQRTYPTLDAAIARMRGQHAFLTEEQATHLTRHGTRKAEDGTLSWKFDPAFRTLPPTDLPASDLHRLWARVTCPVLLAYGAESWASNPATDGRAAHFPHAQISLFEKAGHWLHHQHLDAFVTQARAHLA